jgi:hypothetical protein
MQKGGKEGKEVENSVRERERKKGGRGARGGGEESG